jgi:MFS family permease
MMTGLAPARSLRGLVGLLSAEAAALSANRLLIIAVPWFVLTTTGSVVSTGLVSLFQITPFVIAQALAGPLIDRIGPRRVSVIGDVVAMIAVATVPLLYAVDALPVWALMVLLAIFGAADGPATAAKAVFIPSVTEAAGQPLERGTGLKTAVERTASVIGPAMAGLLIAATGGTSGLWVAAVLLAASAVITVGTLANPVTDQAAACSDGESYLARLRHGMAFLRQERLLRAIVGVLVTTNLLDQTFIAVLLPVWAKASGHGVGTVGLAVSVLGGASLLSSLIAAAIGHRLPRRAVFLIGFVLGGVPRFAVLALDLPIWAVLTVIAISGLSFGFVNPVIGAISYERIPPELLGRVQTLAGALSWSGIPLGGLFGAMLITLAGVSGALWLAGACYLVSVVVPAMRPEWSQMRRADPSAPVPPQDHATNAVE